MTFLYPTASTTAIFLDGYHVEQAYQVQYKESVNKIPIYGYNDYTYSKIAVGKSLVQGILVINFISPNYLSAVLKGDIKQVNTKARNTQFSNLGEDSTKDKRLQKDLESEIRTELPQPVDAESREARASYIAALLGSKADPQTRKSMKDALFNSFSSERSQFIDYNDGPSIIGPDRATSTEKSSISIVDKQNLTMDIYYSDPQFSLYWVRFNKVHFYEASQTISQAGAEGSSDPLYEIYSWIASDKKIHKVT